MSTDQLLVEIAEEIEEIEADIARYNQKKSFEYKRARNNGLDEQALRSALAYRRKRSKGGDKLEKREATVSRYLAVLDAALAHAHEVEHQADEPKQVASDSANSRTATTAQKEKENADAG